MLKSFLSCNNFPVLFILINNMLKRLKNLGTLLILLWFRIRLSLIRLFLTVCNIKNHLFIFPNHRCAFSLVLWMPASLFGNFAWILSCMISFSRSLLILFWISTLNILFILFFLSMLTNFYFFFIFTIFEIGLVLEVIEGPVLEG